MVYIYLSLIYIAARCDFYWSAACIGGRLVLEGGFHCYYIVVSGASVRGQLIIEGGLYETKYGISVIEQLRGKITEMVLIPLLH